jgi:hypothetical protein
VSTCRQLHPIVVRCFQPLSVDNLDSPFVIQCDVIAGFKETRHWRGKSEVEGLAFCQLINFSFKTDFQMAPESVLLGLYSNRRTYGMPKFALYKYHENLRHDFIFWLSTAIFVHFSAILVLISLLTPAAKCGSLLDTNVALADVSVAAEQSCKQTFIHT